MKLLSKKINADPVTQTVTTTGAHGEKVQLKPFSVQRTAGDEVEGYGTTAQTPAEPPQGRLKINIPLLGSIVIK
ncbi:hypothetical protein HYV64_00560 [Candidatus Shapirobacteria bacterium]|nr:hypothetical protein [Candidatus Shapirobacteria bacterium]